MELLEELKNLSVKKLADDDIKLITDQTRHKSPPESPKYGSVLDQEQCLDGALVDLAFSINSVAFSAPDEERKVIVSELTADLVKGRNAIITGDSGSGKTSLLRILKGLWHIKSGLISYHWHSLPYQVLFLPQRPYFPAGDTLRQQMMYPTKVTLKKTGAKFQMDSSHKTASSPLDEALESLNSIEFGSSENMDSPYDDQSPNQPIAPSLMDFSDHPPPPSDVAQASSPLSSMSENDFVKLDKPEQPTDLLGDLGVQPPHHKPPEVDITPSDDLAPPGIDDMHDFAVSPQDAASVLADNAGQSLEDFLSQESPVQDPYRKEPPGMDFGMAGRGDASPLEEAAGDKLGHAGAGFGGPGGIYSDDHLIDRPQEPEEKIYEREGPLTLGQPVVSGTVPGLDFSTISGAQVTPPDSLERESHPRPPSPPPAPVPVKQEPVAPPVVSVPKPPTTTEETCCSGEVLDLVYWRDVKKSGVVFGVSLVVLVCLACFSLISVLAYAGLILLALTLSFRIYKTVLSTIQKNDQGNPFKPYLEKDLHLPQDRVHEQVDVVLQQAEDIAKHLRRLFLVQDIFETAKFGVLLWAMTYVGAWFSGMTLIILAFIGAFTVPKFYETYKEQIDQYYGKARTHVKNAYSQVEDKLPFLKKKTQ